MPSPPQLDFDAEEVSEQLVPFYRWRDARIVSDPAILGGEPVFRGSRFSVRRIGDALSAQDVEFARRYARANPRVGRLA